MTIVKEMFKYLTIVQLIVIQNTIYTHDATAMMIKIYSLVVRI